MSIKVSDTGGSDKVLKQQRTTVTVSRILFDIHVRRCKTTSQVLIALRSQDNLQSEPFISLLAIKKRLCLQGDLYSTANDLWTGNDPQIGPKMIPPENEEWHGVVRRVEVSA